MPFPVQIDALTNSLSVLRDDVVAGGTKRRALDLVLKDMPHNDIAYAGTIFGHGALALAHACREAGKRAHLYIASNDDNHPMMNRLRDAGAIIERCAPLPVEQLHAQAKGDYIFPLGFDTPVFHEAMVAALKPIDVGGYSEIWCSAVSGTLARALQAAYPQMCLRIVSMAKSGSGDFFAPEKYHQSAQTPPPYPSCAYTDAKVWQFASKLAAPDALIWNTAG